MWVASGRPGRARRLYEQALQTADRGRCAVPRATADLHVGLAELDRELDDLPAQRNTSRRPGCSANGPPSPRTGTAGTSSWRRSALPRGDYDAATRLLDQAEALYRPGFYPDVRPIAA